MADVPFALELSESAQRFEAAQAQQQELQLQQLVAQLHADRDTIVGTFGEALVQVFPITDGKLDTDKVDQQKIRLVKSAVNDLLAQLKAGPQAPTPPASADSASAGSASAPQRPSRSSRHEQRQAASPSTPAAAAAAEPATPAPESPPAPAAEPTVAATPAAPPDPAPAEERTSLGSRLVGAPVHSVRGVLSRGNPN